VLRSCYAQWQASVKEKNGYEAISCPPCVYILLLYVGVNSRARCLAKRESPSHPLRTEYLNFLWKDCQRTEGAKSRPVRRIEQSCVVNAGCIARDKTLLGYASH
jgi:hypothetical protein